MLRLGPFCILSDVERKRLLVTLGRAEREMALIEAKTATLREQQTAIIDAQGRLLGEARRERDLAHARAGEYRDLFVEQQAEIDSLQRQLSIAWKSPARMPNEGKS